MNVTLFILTCLLVFLCMLTDDLYALFMTIYLGYSGRCVPRVVHQRGVTPTGEQRVETGCLEMINDLASRVS